MRKTLATLIMLLAAGMVSAQQLFRQDDAVRTGRLKNGLTYYIRHNAEPKQRAYFYIAQKVGAIQEESNQRGLAHFLEHMAFNGSTHFPGTSLRSYLERIGVKFGADLNAYTAVEETVYNIDNVPTTVPGAVDSCLLILHDWSHDLSLTDADIDDERGVIQEEWRQRNTASQRMNEQMMPVIMAGSKYADAMPIGHMDVVMNFRPETLRQYYARWYRPDLQGIIVVGDIDVDEVEKKIKKVFADIASPAKDAPERQYYTVPDNREPIVFIGTDKETTSTSAVIYFKNDAVPRSQRNTREAMLNSMYASFLYNMFHDRTRDIAQRPGAPFALAYARFDDYFLSNTKTALQAIVSCHSRNGGIQQGMEALLREVQRVRQHGFTEGEFDRYRKEMLTSIDRMLKEKDKRQSLKFVQEYVRNFLDESPIPSLEDEAAFYRTELPKLKAEDMNRWFRSLFRQDGSNLVVTVTMPKNDTLTVPSKEELVGIVRKMEAEHTDPYQDVLNTLPLLPKEPAPGTVTSETTDRHGRTVMKLSNGATVIVKKTDFSKDQILVQAMGRGGYSLYSPEDYRLGSLMGMASGVAGLGNWNLADMQKNLVGVNASVQAGVAENYQSVAGSCSSKDLSRMLEMMHAAMLYPNKDSLAFAALTERLEKSTREAEGKPTRVYGDSLNHVLYGDNPYARDLKATDYRNVDYDHLLDLYRRSFSDGGSFTYSVIGNVDIDSLRPLVCKYLASIPATGENPQARPVLQIKPGSRTCVFEKEQETPKAQLYIRYTTPCEFTLKNQLVASVLGQVLTMKYTQTIREEAGAAYSPSAGAKVDYYPSEAASIIVRFPTSPESLDKARELVDKGLDELIANGPTQAEVDKVKEYNAKVMQSNRTVNAYWQYAMSYEWNHGTDYDADYDEALKSITVADVQRMAAMIKAGQRIECDMTTPRNK